ncbi:hypothetical protein Agabi119p4_3331 [Agaricus bisporus var. burnettii]|uniref:HIT-type domain-containing protein n=1 Tax=Agaricus bisporus var. burnettii TaxID=192524 RepID=A0A8H7KJA1_AGABI|nr:hypothetical protein Agabi119p4_3331 [Agaricus bisporus var. burnettii]
MGALHTTIERPTSPFSITSSSSSSILDFYTRLAPKSQPTTTLSSIVVSSNDSGTPSDEPQYRNASLKLKGMMKLSSRYNDEKKIDDDDDDMMRGRHRRQRYPSLPVGRFVSSITRNFSTSSSRTPSPPHLRPPRIVITPPPSTPTSPHTTLSPNSNSNSPSSHTTHSTLIMNPILAKLERESKLCGVQMTCSTCGKIGRGYPCCGRCGELWCSRECRIGGMKKHVCRKTI